jgi:hypothetical protein
MKTTAFLSTLLSTIALASAAPLEARTSVASISYPLTTPGRIFPPGTLPSNNFYYANNSIYLGDIKYQIYSEPLVVQGADETSQLIAFRSIHSGPSPGLNLYHVPRQSQPLGLDTHPPEGARSDKWAFNGEGNLESNGHNFFYACQDEGLRSMNTWQMWWVAGDWPQGWECRGPLNMKRGEGCGRE